ncbi:phage tail protein [Clostridium gasigenes]|nr:phage tail protein [Clostridium gasigenes]
MLKEGEIYFNCNSSLDLNLKLEKYPSVPSSNEEYEEIKVDGRNGSLYINKGTYPNKTLSFLFSEISNRIHVDLELLMVWLTEIEDNRLFYGRDDRVFIVKKIIKGDFEQEFRNLGNIKIDFICEPFMSDKYPFEYEITTNNFKFNYGGTAPTEPLIRIYGTGNIQLIINDETMQIKNVNNYVEIDSGLLQVRDSNGQSKDFDSIGDFTIFTKGDYVISYSGKVSKVEVEYTTKYL